MVKKCIKNKTSAFFPEKGKLRKKEGVIMTENDNLMEVLCYILQLGCK